MHLCQILTRGCLCRKILPPLRWDRSRRGQRAAPSRNHPSGCFRRPFRLRLVRTIRHVQSFYRVYHVDKISVGWIKTNKARHSLEEQLSRVEARNPAQNFLLSTEFGRVLLKKFTPHNIFSLFKRCLLNVISNHLPSPGILSPA